LCPYEDNDGNKVLSSFGRSVFLAQSCSLTLSSSVATRPFMQA
jgi:hypothetical protein